MIGYAWNKLFNWDYSFKNFDFIVGLIINNVYELFFKHSILIEYSFRYEWGLFTLRIFKWLINKC